MYLILLIAMVALPVVVLWTLAIGASMARLPASVSWGGLSLVAVVGVVGTKLGVDLTNQAVVHASKEMTNTMIANGLMVSLYTSIGALMVVVAGLIAVPLVAWLPAVLKPGPEAEFDRTSLMSSVVGAVLGGVCMAGITGLVVVVWMYRLPGPEWMLLPFAVGLSLPMWVASARISTEGEHQGRIAGTRFLMGTAAFLALGFAGEVFVLMSDGLTFMALANAKPEMWMTMISGGEGYVISSRWVGWASGLMPGMAGWFGALPQIKFIDSRQMIGAAWAGVQVLVIGACIWATHHLTQLDLMALLPK